MLNDAGTYVTTGFGDTANPILAAATVTYTYRTKASPSDLKDVTQLASVATAGVNTESYTYDTEGRVSAKTQALTSRASYPFVTDYIYDGLDRVTDARYPAEYGNGVQPRKLVHQTYDVASRLTGLTVDGQSQASNIVYNAASQTTQLKVGATGTNQITENYTYDAPTGLLSNQTVVRGATTLLNLLYDYAGTNGKRTGQLTEILNNLDHGKDRGYEYDALGRLKKATGGSTPSWTQTYSYDRYGNRTSVTATGTADDGSAIPRDGLASVAYSATTNRVTTAGFAYDATGNQVRALTPGSTTTWQKYQYDAANRLVKVKADDNVTVLATYTYGDSSGRLITDENGYRTYYVSEGGTVIAEYSETPALPTTPKWSKSYVYLGGRLLSTLTPDGSGGEAVNYHHPDRLGTRLVTDPVAGTSFEQVTLPFGTSLGAESTGTTNRRFTSYDRSGTTGIDYAVNRHYDWQQGRFTQVDPAGMDATDLSSPQTLNLYAYCTNDPINHTDPSGLGFFSAIGKFFKKFWKVLIVIAIVVAVAVLIPGVGAALLNVLKTVGNAIWSGIKAAASAVWSGLKAVAHSLYSLFTSQKFPLLANLQDPLPPLPKGYIWIATDFGPAIAAETPIVFGTVTVLSPTIILGAGAAAALSGYIGTLGGTVGSQTASSQMGQKPNARLGANTDACGAYSQGGRPDLAAICRAFGNGTKRNLFRRCLLDHFYAPRTGRGGYLEGPGELPPFSGFPLGPVVGISTHLNCLDRAF